MRHAFNSINKIKQKTIQSIRPKAFVLCLKICYIMLKIIKKFYK